MKCTRKDGFEIMGKNAKTQRQEQMREYQERLRREEEEKKKKEQQVFIWAMIAVFALAVIVAAVVIIGAVGNGNRINVCQRKHLSRCLKHCR